MTFFSERFGIDAGALEAHGALDVSRCPCDEIFDSHRLENTVIHVPHMTAAQAWRQTAPIITKLPKSEHAGRGVAAAMEGV